LTEQKRVNINLETNLARLTEEVVARSNEVAALSSKLAKTESDAKTDAQTAREELAKRNARITELETQKDDLTKRMGELNVSITTLEGQIADTERKLVSAEGDRDFLMKELKRLQAEKAELERQFNNLAFLREQVRKLRDEMSIARRLEWIRRGLYGSPTKGGERLQQGFAGPTTAPAPQTNFNLNVELRQDGSVRVVPPQPGPPGSTNAPSPK
jgi:chromosome segregation ATPase